MRFGSLSIPFMALALVACGSEVEEADSTEVAETSNEAPEEIVVDGPELRIIAFGDSLFAGYNLAEHEGYPERLQRALRQAGINATVVDAGVSGDTSSGGLERIGFLLDQQPVKPDLFILELGGNDMLRGIQPAATRENFEGMLAELRRRDIPVLLMGMRSPPNYGPEYQQEFDGLYGELASEYNADLVPFWLESIYQSPELFQSDRIHPTAEGIDRLVADTLDDVQAALPDQG